MKAVFYQIKQSERNNLSVTKTEQMRNHEGHEGHEEHEESELSDIFSQMIFGICF